MLRNASDPENDSLTVTSFTQGNSGSVTQGANGQLVYTPNAGFTGTDHFTYTISDGNGGTDTAKVTVSVNDTKVNAKNDSRVLESGNTVTVNVLANDDADASLKRIVSGPSNGSAKIVNGKIVYTADAGFVGTDSLVYQVVDAAGNKDTAKVTFKVKAAPNKAPVAKNDSRSTVSGKAVTISVLGNDSDTNGDNLSVIGVSAPKNGKVTRNSKGQLVYTPHAGFVGTDVFYYKISDGKGGTDTAKVTVKVTHKK